MEDSHPIEKLMVTAMNSIKQMIDVNTIIGQPINALDNTVIIPISKVGFGFAAGGSEFNDETINSYNRKEKEENIKYRLPFGGGSGAGVSISPVAFLIVQNDNVKILEASHSSVLDKLVEYIPDAVEKVNQIIKRKMDRDDEFYKEEDDFEEEDEEDDDYFDDVDNIDEIDDDNIDEDFDNNEDWLNDEFDEETSKNKKKSKDEGDKSKVNKEKIIDAEDRATVSKAKKKEISQIVENGQGKAKKLEEKIKEIKKSNNA